MYANDDLLNLCMPQSHSYTCGIVKNDVMQGLLHLYVRHHLAFEYEVPGLRAQRLMLPSEMQNVLFRIAKVSNINYAKADVVDFKRLYCADRKTRDILYRAQLMIRRFMETAISTLSMTTSSNQKGQLQLCYQLKNAKKLVLGVSDIKKTVRSFDDSRRVRYIKTAFFK
uniref:DNA-directed RNA polymerase n=1 Tax=Panagrellus redivivus TaxID=6233 RepID=A0A7E4UM30_PANRE